MTRRRRALPALLLVAALAASPAAGLAQDRSSVDRLDEAHKDGLRHAELSPQAEEWVNTALRGFVASRMRAAFIKRAELEESAVVDAFEQEVMPRLALEGIGGDVRTSMLGTVMDRMVMVRDRLGALDAAQEAFKAAVVAAVSDPAAQGRLIYDAIDRLQASAPGLWADAAAEPGAAKGAADRPEDGEPWYPPALERLVAAELAEPYATAGVPEDGAKRERLDASAARLAHATSEWLTLALQGR